MHFHFSLKQCAAASSEDISGLKYPESIPCKEKLSEMDSSFH